MKGKAIGFKLFVIALALGLLTYVFYQIAFYMVLGETEQDVHRRSIVQKEQLNRLRIYQKIWDSNHVKTYTVNIQYTGHMSVICSKATIKVENRLITSFSGVDPAGGEFDPKMCEAIFNQFLVEKLYIMVEEFLTHDGPMRVRLEELEFDQHYGYITRLCVDKRILLFDDESFKNNLGYYCIYS